MSDRYFVEPPIQGDHVALRGPEAHHAIHVKRAKPGDRIVLLDGSGAEFSARVERVRRGRVELSVLDRAEVDRELPIDLTLGTSLPKADRQRWLIEKAVELGVTRIVPLRASRSVAQATANTLGRLRRTVIEASKQCGRNRLAEITQPQAWAEFVAGGPDDAVRLLAHPLADRAKADRPAAARLDRIVPGQAVLLAVGPEGGFADEEIAAATAAGWEPIDLGPRTLRIETAALLLVALVLRSLP